MQNVEFKAELRDVELARAQCAALSARQVAVLDQQDTYFKMPDGRLKKRETRGRAPVWIFYHRSNRLTPKLSNFTILSDRQAVTRWGTQSLRPWVTVVKRRELWQWKGVRIHLDDVRDLGRFIEFEARVDGSHSPTRAHSAIAHLREAFAPAMGEPISVSYCDLAAQEVDDRASPRASSEA